jgi:hypothetical protein
MRELDLPLQRSYKNSEKRAPKSMNASKGEEARNNKNGSRIVTGKEIMPTFLCSVWAGFKVWTGDVDFGWAQ